MDLFISTFLKMFFIMAPFFALTVFLTVTQEATTKEKKTLAVKVTVSIIISSLILLFFGKHIFSVFVIPCRVCRLSLVVLFVLCC